MMKIVKLVMKQETKSKTVESLKVKRYIPDFQLYDFPTLRLNI
jgi:hypothetical protein